MKFKLPWVSRRDLEATEEYYKSWIHDLRGDNRELADRIRYLESERESIRLASLTPDPEPITILDPPEHDEDIARWEGEGGA